MAIVIAASSASAASQEQIDKATKNLAIIDGIVYSIFDPAPVPGQAVENPLFAAYNAASAQGPAALAAYLDSLSPADANSTLNTLGDPARQEFLAALSPAAALALLNDMPPGDFQDLANGGMPPGSALLAEFQAIQQPFLDAINNNNPFAIADWSKFNANGANLSGKDLSWAPALGLTGANFDSAQWVDWTNFEGLDWTGFDPTDRDFEHSNLANSTGLDGAKLSNAQALLDTNFQNVDLTGFTAVNTALLANNFEGATGLADGAALNGARRGEWENVGMGNGLNGSEWVMNYSQNFDGLVRANLTGQSLSALDTNNISLRGTNLSNTTGLTAEKLAMANGLGADGGQTMNLSGTGITRVALENALIAAGKDPFGNPNYDLNGITF